MDTTRSEAQPLGQPPVTGKTSLPRKRDARQRDTVPTPVAVAMARLRQSPYAPLRQLECSFHEGVLTLRGRVPSWYLKQLSQEAMQDIPGVEEVNNRVDV